MNRKSILVLAIVLTFTIVGFAQNLNDFEKNTDTIFKAWNNLDKPGGAAGIIKDGEIVYLKGFGIANLETNEFITPQTKFQLGEMSKQFTTLAILLLEAQGKISLDEDIHKYLPELPEYEYTVTLGHLLNHSSGLHDINRISNIINGSMDILTQVKALKLVALQKELSFKPGTDFSFHESVTESVLMAEIVARSSNQSFANFVKTNIFEPLGMKNSLIRDDSNAILTNVAQPYQKEEGEAYKKLEVNSSVVGAINGYSSAEDLAKWYLNYTKPKGNVGRLIQKLDTPVELSNGEKYNYYWGDMAIGREFSHPERGLPIFWNFGLQGGYGTNVFRYLDQNITSFVLGNSNQYNGALAGNAIEPFVKDLYLLPPVVDYKSLKTKNVSISKLKDLEGHYWFRKVGYASKLFVENDTLRSSWMFTERSQKLVPLKDDVFQQVGTNDNIRLFKFKKEGDGGMRFFFTFNESKPDIMVRYVPVNPSAQDLQSYTGTYYSKAYGSLFSFYVEDGKLIAKHLDHEDIAFRPITKDVFASRTTFFNAIEFIRDETNAVKSFIVDTEGVRKFEFIKVK